MRNPHDSTNGRTFKCQKCNFKSNRLGDLRSHHWQKHFTPKQKATIKANVSAGKRRAAAVRQTTTSPLPVMAPIPGTGQRSMYMPNALTMRFCPGCGEKLNAWRKQS